MPSIWIHQDVFPIWAVNFTPSGMTSNWMLGYKILCYLIMLWWKLYWYLSSLLSSSTSSSSYSSSFFCSLSPILHPVWHFPLSIYWKLTSNEQPFSLYSFNSANSYFSKCLSVFSNAYKWMKDKLYWIACLEAGYVICWKKCVEGCKNVCA